MRDPTFRLCCDTRPTCTHDEACPLRVEGHTCAECSAPVGYIHNPHCPVAAAIERTLRAARTPAAGSVSRHHSEEPLRECCPSLRGTPHLEACRSNEAAQDRVNGTEGTDAAPSPAPTEATIARAHEVTRYRVAEAGHGRVVIQHRRDDGTLEAFAEVVAVDRMAVAQQIADGLNMLHQVRAGTAGSAASPDGMTKSPEGTIPGGGKYALEQVEPHRFRLVINTPGGPKPPIDLVAVPRSIDSQSGNEPLRDLVAAAMRDTPRLIGSDTWENLAGRLLDQLALNGVTVALPVVTSAAPVAGSFYADREDTRPGVAKRMAGGNHRVCFVPTHAIWTAAEVAQRLNEAETLRETNERLRRSLEDTMNLSTARAEALERAAAERDEAQAKLTAIDADRVLDQAAEQLRAADAEFAKVRDFLRFESGRWHGDMTDMPGSTLVETLIAFARTLLAENEAKRAETELVTLPAPGRDPATVDQCIGIIRQAAEERGDLQSWPRIRAELIKRLRAHIGETGLPDNDGPGSGRKVVDKVTVERTAGGPDMLRFPDGTSGPADLGGPSLPEGRHERTWPSTGVSAAQAEAGFREVGRVIREGDRDPAIPADSLWQPETKPRNDPSPFRVEGPLVLSRDGLPVASCSVGVTGSLSARRYGCLAERIAAALNAQAAPAPVSDLGSYTAGECELPEEGSRGAAVFDGEGGPFCYIDPRDVVGTGIAPSIARAQMIADALNRPANEIGLVIELSPELRAELDKVRQELNDAVADVSQSVAQRLGILSEPGGQP